MRTSHDVGESRAHTEPVAWIRGAVAAGRKHHIKSKSPWRHNVLNLTVAAALLSLIASLALAGRLVPRAYYLALAPWAFGWAYFALFILVVHEASHGMFVTLRHPRWARRLNRAAGTAVAVFFATDYKKHWEVGHLAHHVRPLEPADPQRHNSLVGRPLLLRVAACLFIPGFLFVERTLLRTRKTGGASSSSRGTMIAFVVCWTTVLYLAARYVTWESALGMFLGIHVIVALNHIKGALEHGGALGDHPNPFLRSRTTFFAGRWLVMPLNITLHFEHHLNYRVPWYSLPSYHQELIHIVPAELADSVWNHRPLSQLSGALGPISAAPAVVR